MKTRVVESTYVVEGVAGVYFYHLSETGGSYRPAFCGEHRVMTTQIPVTAWGVRSSHLHEKYCAECTRIATERGILKVAD